MTKKILVVEDCEEMLGAFRLGLKSAGFAIATATNGLEAVKKAQTINPDLILLDLMLPELDGLGVCARLKTSSTTAEIPVVLVTGLSERLVRAVAEEVGAEDCMDKTIGLPEMVSRLKALLARRETTSMESGLAQQVPVVMTPVDETLTTAA